MTDTGPAKGSGDETADLVPVRPQDRRQRRPPEGSTPTAGEAHGVGGPAQVVAVDRASENRALVLQRDQLDSEQVVGPQPGVHATDVPQPGRRRIGGSQDPEQRVHRPARGRVRPARTGMAAAVGAGQPSQPASDSEQELDVAHARTRLQRGRAARARRGRLPLRSGSDVEAHEDHLLSGDRAQRGHPAPAPGPERRHPNGTPIQVSDPAPTVSPILRTAPSEGAPAVTNAHRHIEMTPKWFTVPQVAEMLGFSVSKTKTLVISGDLRSLKAGRSRRVLPEWVDEYVARQANEAEVAR